MRAYATIMDSIYEVDGKISEDGESFLVISGPQGSGLAGAILRPNRWAVTKSVAYLQLEWELDYNYRRWTELYEEYVLHKQLQDAAFAQQQIKIFKDLIPRCKNMEPEFIKEKNRK